MSCFLPIGDVRRTSGCKPCRGGFNRYHVARKQETPCKSLATCRQLGYAVPVYWMLWPNSSSVVYCYPPASLSKQKKQHGNVVPALAKRIVTGEDGMRAFVLAWPEESGSGRPIMLTQRDIRELQFAKGAIASGIEVVMQELGVTAEDLEEIYLAGSFGNYINPQSARIIGLVPPVPVERIKAVGNAAGEGAKMALLSFRERQVVRSLPKIVEYHELSGRADFNDSFFAVLQFPDLADLGLMPTT